MRYLFRLSVEVEGSGSIVGSGLFRAITKELGPKLAGTSLETVTHALTQAITRFPSDPVAEGWTGQIDVAVGPELTLQVHATACPAD